MDQSEGHCQCQLWRIWLIKHPSWLIIGVQYISNHLSILWSSTCLELFRIPGRFLEILLNSQRVPPSNIPMIDGDSISCQCPVSLLCSAGAKLLCPMVRIWAQGVKTSVTRQLQGIIFLVLGHSCNKSYKPPSRM